MSDDDDDVLFSLNEFGRGETEGGCCGKTIPIFGPKLSN